MSSVNFSGSTSRRNQCERIFGQAIQHQKQGLNELALLACQKILKIDPYFIDAHMMQGVIMAQRKNFEAASEYFKRITMFAPRHSSAHYNWGLMLMQLNQVEEAKHVFSHLLSLEPAHILSLNSMGVIHAQSRNFPEAIKLFEKSLQHQPSQPDILNNLGNCRLEMQAPQEAKLLFQKALALSPSHPDALFNLAKVEVILERLDIAVDLYGTLLELYPDHHPARVNLAKIFIDEGLAKQAIELLLNQKAWVIQDPVMSFTLGVAYKECDQYEQAIDYFDLALKIDPTYNSAYINRASCHRELGHLDAALKDHAQARDIADPVVQATWWSLYASLCEDTHDHEKVEEAFLKAMALDPSNIKPAYNYGMWLLKQQRFKEAWSLYQYRHQIKTSMTVVWMPGLPVWRGGALNGRILIIGEQGVGDQVFHSKWLKLYVNRHGSPACVTVDDRLIPVMRRSFPEIHFWPQSDRVSLKPLDFDVQLGMADLAALMSLDPRVDALVTRPSLITQAPAELPLSRQTQRPLVGLSWKSGNTKNSTDKSISLLDAMTQFKGIDVDWVNLQYGDVSAEIEQVKMQLGIEILQIPGLDVFNDLEGLMRMIQACDFVISTSNSTAHLCGAIGQRGVVMVPYNKGKLWYWHTQDGPSSWYPSLTIVHCQQQEGWAHVLNEVDQHLKRHLADSGKH